MLSELNYKTWIDINDKDYNLFCTLVYDKVGIILNEQKRALFTGRLQKLLKKNKFTSFSKYYEYVINDKSGDALSELINYISTNHTYFWRESGHFDFFLKKNLPEIKQKLIQSGKNNIRIWCAGSSTGEEAFTLVILMMEFFGDDYKNLDAGVLATDISQKVIHTAKEGIYQPERVRYLPDYLLDKYLIKLDSGNYSVIDEVKKEETFRRFNLMNEVFPFKNSFDIIFCRNIMIYFDLIS